MPKALRFLQITAEHRDCPFFFYRISNHKIFIPKYLDNARSYRSRLNFTNIEAAIEEKSFRE